MVKAVKSRRDRRKGKGRKVFRLKDMFLSKVALKRVAKDRRLYYRTRRRRSRKGIVVSFYHGAARFFDRIRKFREAEHFIVLRKTANNLFISAMGRSGTLYFNRSAGRLKIKGPNRSTTEAAERIARQFCTVLKEREIKTVGLVLRSPAGRLIKAAVRTIQKAYGRNLHRLVLIRVPRPHGFMRGKKTRRT